MKTTNTKPPVEIFYVLHDAEKHGVELPKSVDDWWFSETAMIEETKTTELQKETLKKCLTKEKNERKENS